MHLVLLSGGSGKRLWPLSNNVRSKQFLKLFMGKNGERESIVQRVYSQIIEALPQANVLIATNTTQKEVLKGQLGENVQMVIEPARRDTYPAIVLACADLYYNKNASLNDSVAVLPVDPFTELGYFHAIKYMDVILQEGHADITLMGIKPLMPTSKYGYIIPNEIIKEGVYTVSKFIEKPSESVSAELINDGAYWNGGVFSFRLGYVLDIAHAQLSFNSFNELYEQYNQLNKISFDYEVVEKTNRIVMVTYDGKWTDIGTWRTLADEIDTPMLGEAVVEDTTSTYIINEMNVPIVALGTNNLIIAASPDGILVSDLIKSSHLKLIVDKFEDEPMYEDALWGQSSVLDKTNHVKQIKLYAEKEMKCLVSDGCKITLIITKGDAMVVIGEKAQNASVGDVVQVPANTAYKIKAKKDTIIIQVITI